jgi:asparagine synthase (glutamine-hydrolysing)
MCGIYGVIHFSKDGQPCEPLLSKMGNVIQHRGPDDSGHYVDGPVGIGMRRLSIIDVQGGHQPISNEDGTIWLVLNGEIYNYRSLRAELERKGHSFRTESDTEVIVHLYEECGTEFFQRLRGMFGVALWDSTKQRLVLGRDRIGEKPLYVRREGKRLLFASELKSILQVEGVPRELNHEALRKYLAHGYVPAPLTLLEGMEKILPGHFLVVENGKMEDHSYWDVPTGPKENHSVEEWIGILQAKLTETVNAQLVSDVPLGAFLSGGIDSSTIVAIMARASSRPVKTYSIGYEGDQSYYNELPFARIVAKAFATDHHEIVVRPDVSELLPKLIWHLDEPIADSACLTTYLISRLARESVTVILSGVGGDELFGGYRRYLGDSVRRWYHLLPSPIRKSVLPAILRVSPKDRATQWKDYVRYAAAFVETAEQDAVSCYLGYVTLFSAQSQHELIQPEFRDPGRAGLSGLAIDDYLARGEGIESLDRIMYADLKTSLPDDLLALTDRMSMAASVECRAPLVDYELIELAGRIPSNLKVRGFTMKYLFKKAVAPWLPKEVIQRKKRGFGAPVGSWLRRELQPLIQDLLSEQEVRKRGIFQWSGVQAILDAHQSQRADYTDQVFALLALEIWCRTYLDEHNPGMFESDTAPVSVARAHRVT